MAEFGVVVGIDLAVERDQIAGIHVDASGLSSTSDRSFSLNSLYSPSMIFVS